MVQSWGEWGWLSEGLADTKLISLLHGVTLDCVGCWLATLLVSGDIRE